LRHPSKAGTFASAEPIRSELPDWSRFLGNSTRRRGPDSRLDKRTKADSGHAPIGTPRDVGATSERAALERVLRQKRDQIESLDRARAALEKEAEDVADKIAALPIPSSPETKAHPCESERSSTDKIRIFLDLFRGRDDVYPIRWKNPCGGEGRRGSLAPLFSLEKES
jgi:hypothetical protein